VFNELDIKTYILAIKSCTYFKFIHFAKGLDVLKYTSKAAEHYGNIRTTLEKQGQIIGVNDLHIAGHARSESLVLVTNNVKEFEPVEALRLDNWV